MSSHAVPSVADLKRGAVYVVFSTLFFSTMEIALKLLATKINPVQMTFLRFAVAAVVLSPLALRGIRAKGLRLRLDDYAFFAVSGFVCVVVSMIFFQFAVLYAQASVVAVLFSCNPVFVIPFAYLALREKIHLSTWATMLLSVIGMVCIIGPGSGSTSMAGVTLTLLSAMTFAIYGVLGRARGARYGGIALTCFSFVFGSLELLLLILLSRVPAVADALRAVGLPSFAAVPLLAGITWSALPGLVYIAVCVTGLGYMFYFLAMEKTSAAIGSVVFYIKPALATALAFFVLGEPLGANKLWGIGFIAVGSAIAFHGNLRRMRQQR